LELAFKADKEAPPRSGVAWWSSQDFWVSVLGFGLPVAGGVLTYLATAGLVAVAKRRKERNEYKRLHELVFALVDDALALSRTIAEAGDSLASRVEGWAITNGYWIQIQPRYAELCQSPDEVHDIARFFEYVTGFALLAREVPQPVHYASGSRSGLRDQLLLELRTKMEAQAAKVKSTYWPPGYKSPFYPHHPNPPRNFS
jgi:hypothetical protein